LYFPVHLSLISGSVIFVRIPSRPCLKYTGYQAVVDKNILASEVKKKNGMSRSSIYLVKKILTEHDVVREESDVVFAKMDANSVRIVFLVQKWDMKNYVQDICKVCQNITKTSIISFISWCFNYFLLIKVWTSECFYKYICILNKFDK